MNALIGDLNGDGAPDIVVGLNGSPPAVYFNNGTAEPFQNVAGVFVAPPPGANSAGIGYGLVTSVDVNGDGHPDLAIAGFNTPSLIYLHDGTLTPFNGATGVAIGTQDVAYSQAFGDVNGDGFVDMLVANTNHVLSRLYLTQGAPLTNGAYTTVQIGTDVGYGQDARIADVNGDGKLDLILTYTVASTVASDPSGIAIYLNNGTSTPFGGVMPLRLLAGQSVTAVAISDLNGDGKPDLVAATLDPSSGSVALRVFVNAGSASQPFASAQMLQPDANIGGVCLGLDVADVNADGHPDVLFACQAPLGASPPPARPAAGSIYLNNGSMSPFANVAPIDIPATPQSGYGRSVAVGTLVKNRPPAALLVDGPPSASYATLTLDQNPAAADDAAVCAINQSVGVSVLANDAAGPGQSLRVDTLAIETAPSHGTATVNSTTGLVTFRPVAGYSGTDGFQYTVRDAVGGLSNAASVRITVQPPPVAVNDTATIPANQSVTLNVLSNDTSAGGTLDAASILITVAPLHGTAVVAAGKVAYAPTMGYSGLDTFQYSVRDNLGTSSNVATVSLEVTAPPAAGGGGGSMGLLELTVLSGLLLMRYRPSIRPADARRAGHPAR